MKIDWKVLAEVSKDTALDFFSIFISIVTLIILYIGPLIIVILTGNWWFLLLYIVSIYIDVTITYYRWEMSKDNDNYEDC